MIKSAIKNMELESVHEYKDEKMKFHLMRDDTDGRIDGDSCWMRSEFESLLLPLGGER
jgi:hypothetical protein